MRFYEIIREDADSDAILLSVLSYLKQQALENGVSAKIKTQALVNMVKNAGDNAFNYETLVRANEKNPAVKNLLKSFNQNEIIIGHDSKGSDTFNPDQVKEPTDIVGGMAKAALNKRS